MKIKQLIKDLYLLEEQGVKDVYFFNDEEGNNTYGSCIFNQFATDKTKMFLSPNEIEFVDFDVLMKTLDYSKMDLAELKELATADPR